MNLAFDHLAVGARSLDEGADWVRARLGVDLEPGGRHPGRGTHNMLLSLGPHEYLELIAPDPLSDAPPQWFGLAGFDGPPRLAGWVARATPLAAPPGTRVIEAARGDLRWRITLPDAGQMAGGGAQPMLIDWGTGPYPAERLPDRGIRLSRLALPLDALDIGDSRVVLRASRMTATLSVGKQEVTL
ncbi:VOC family protein [Paracoccus beibuensis]|uniref:VOC family protein n=1 Tax=Paracoccus beibuensis TaxID=547602 RepID=UPI00223ED9CD|nr:VOC family protein [Paracoccus beibuensis]